MSETANQRWAATIVGALVAGGVRHAVIAPGSRSTPLALAFADRPDVRSWSIIDERSAAFFALGLAKGGGAPTAVICTSGTAGAHFLPAVMEACEGATPLVVLTADRPWELHGFGAPQTTEQRGLFGRFVRHEVDFPEPLSTPEGLAHAVAVTARAVMEATGGRPGPVHLNVPFREPLAPPTTSPGPVIDCSPTPYAPSRHLASLERVTAAVAQAQRGLIVVGPRERADGLPAAVHNLGKRLGFPVLAEAASNARYGHTDAVAMYDALLRDRRFAEAMKPDVVLRFGGGLTAKAPQAWLDDSGARVFELSEDGRVFDPLHRVEQVVVGDVVESCARLSELEGRSSQWRSTWLAAEARVRERLAAHAGALTEPLVARELVASLPAGAGLVLSSSMPIRDVDAFAPVGAPVRVFSNRGVNGIDGVMSTALGVAASTNRPTAALIGDVAVLHDLSAWLVARRHGLSLTVVVPNNDGGGIFHFLPVADRTPHFETLFGTPHGVDLATVAQLGGAQLHRPSDLPQLRQALAAGLEGGLHLVEVKTDRVANVEAHRALFASLAEVAS